MIYFRYYFSSQAIRLMKKCTLIVFVIYALFPMTIFSQVSNPCENDRYLALKQKSLDQMSDREYEYFTRKDEECSEYQSSISTKSKETTIKNSVDINGGTGLFAYRGFTIVGGLNMGSIKYNDSDVADEVDVSMNMGFSIGAETMAGPLKVGGGFVQRGANVEFDLLGETLEGSDIFNYLSGYGLYPFAIQEGLSAFGGFQLGKCIGGKTEVLWGVESESEDLKGKDFALDYGLLLGVDYSINANMGVRASYYLGLADVVEDVVSDLNYKHTGIGVLLLYKMQ